MRIAYITAGAGGMYCGSCLHDNSLAAALLRLGHDVALVPTYTPIRTDEADVSVGRVFYGAINVYLEQRSALFRHTPWMLDRLFNGRRLLDWAARRGSTVDPRELGDLTLSVLEGEHGRQRKELEKLVSWLSDEFRPEIVHITNSMLLGLARRIREQVRVPVVCSLQGEDIFLEQLDAEHRDRVHAALRERATDVDAFVANSRFYADAMARYLGLPADGVRRIPLGLNLSGHGGRATPQPERPFIVGYLARICPEKGLHLLAEAFRDLAARNDPGSVRLRVAGYLGERDRDYAQQVLEQLREWGLGEVVDHVGEVDRAGKIEFLRSLHVLSVPSIYREPKGLYVLEAMANGVPVVQPRHGAFPELVEATGGGLLVEPESARALTDGLQALIDDPARRSALGRAGHDSVHRRFGDTVEAQAMLAVYHECIEQQKAAAVPSAATE